MYGAVCYGGSCFDGTMFVVRPGPARIQIANQATTFHAGDIWLPEATITNPKTKAPVDPSTVTITVTKPNGETLPPMPMTRVAEGVYTMIVGLTEPGKWRAVILATGDYQGAEPESITVLED